MDSSPKPLELNRDMTWRVLALYRRFFGLIELKSVIHKILYGIAGSISTRVNELFSPRCDNITKRGVKRRNKTLN